MPVDNPKRVAVVAVDYIQPGNVVGIGTGSTADCFIAVLARMRSRIDDALPNSLFIL